MKRELTKAEVKAALQRKQDAITQRIDAIEGEAQHTGVTLWERVKARPLVSVGAAAGVGLVVGLVFGGRRDKDRYGLGRTHAALVDDYLDALRDDVRYRVSRGEETGEAIRTALQDRVPLIVQAGAVNGEAKGAVREGFDLFVKTMFSLLVKYAADALALQYLPEGSEARAAATNGDAAVAVSSATSA